MFISSQLPTQLPILGSRSTSIQGSGIPYYSPPSQQSTGKLPTPPLAQGKFTACSSNDLSKNDEDNDKQNPTKTGPATDNNIKTVKEARDDAPTMNPSTHGGSSNDNNTSQEGSQTGNNAV